MDFPTDKEIHLLEKEDQNEYNICKARWVADIQSEVRDWHEVCEKLEYLVRGFYNVQGNVQEVGLTPPSPVMRQETRYEEMTWIERESLYAMN